MPLTIPTRRSARTPKIARSVSNTLEMLEERRLMATFAVTSNLNSGIGTLRDAITQANAAAGADTISFNLPTGSRTITLTSALPAITGPTTVDGTTNPGYTGVPVVEITGNNTLAANGLTINASDSVVRGLAINGMALGPNFTVGRGVVLNGSNNLVEKTYLGLRLNGTTTLTLGRAGVEIIGTSNTVRNNAIASAVFGVYIDNSSSNANSNVISGNFMGTTASGTGMAVGTNLSTGVSINAGNNNRVGGPNEADRNVIALGGFSGVSVSNNAGPVTIQNNYIGVNVAGSAPLVTPGGSYFGVDISVPASGNLIRDNVIANATDTQLRIASASNTLIAGNRIGLTAGGVLAGTGGYGIRVNGSNAGGTRIGTPAVADRNWIMNGHTAGIGVDNYGSIRIQNNVVGLTPGGVVSTTIGDGISLLGITGECTIGGLNANEGNIVAISAPRSMIRANGLSANGTPGGLVNISGNQLGLTLDGTAAAGYNVSSVGINIGNSNEAMLRGNRIGGVGIGIQNEGQNYLYGNQIGLNVAGTDPVAVGRGIETIFGYIGGPGAGEGNLIGDWNTNAINVQDGFGHVIRGNRIGTNVAGTGTYTGTSGITTEFSGTIGGPNAGDGNVITGATNAILLAGGWHVVQGNTLGLPGRPNSTGIRISDFDVSNTLIGGDTAGAANTISHNNGKGIVVSSGAVATNVTFRRNVIHSNGGMAIDLSDNGVTANDPLDADTGPNGLQNFPLLISADSTGGAQTTVSGFVTTSASTPVVVDFYSADAASNEARVWLGSRTLLTDSGGAASFAQTLPFVSGGKFIVATMTNISAFPNGATSELSPGIQVVGPTDTIAPEVASGTLEFESAQRVKLIFSEELLAGSLAVTDLQMKNTTTNVTFTPTSFNYDAASKSVTFAFNNALTDGSYTWTLPAGAVSDPAGNATASPFNGTTWILAGDANRDRTVNFNDLIILAQNYGSNGKTFSHGNFNYDAAGNVGFDDLIILAQRYLSSVLTADPTPAAAPTKAARSVAKDLFA